MTEPDAKRESGNDLEHSVIAQLLECGLVARYGSIEKTFTT